jgi:hypothetical protein
MNGFGDVPIRRHDGFSVQNRPDGFGGPIKSIILTVNLYVGEDNSRAFGSATTFENTLEMHGKLVPNHALCGCDPCVKCLRMGGVKREEMPHLGTIAVRYNNAPIHFQEVDDIAHNPSEDFS